MVPYYVRPRCCISFCFHIFTHGTLLSLKENSFSLFILIYTKELYFQKGPIVHFPFTEFVLLSFSYSLFFFFGPFIFYVQLERH